MKTAILAILILMATRAGADPLTKLGFRTYSVSATSPTECGVFGMTDRLKTDGRLMSNNVQGFSPDDTYSRTLQLGTKGFANYSVLYGKRNLTAVKFTCRVKGASTTVPVKVYLNGNETHFLTLSEYTFIGGY